MSTSTRGFSLLVLLAASCAGGQTHISEVFDTTWQDDQGRSIASVQARLADRPVPAGASVAVGVADQALLGVLLNSGVTWSVQHPVDARPWITNDVVVASGGGEIFAIDAASGRKLWARPATGKLRAAGDDGRTTVVSLEPSSSSGSVLLAIARDGSVVRQLEADVSVGTPAAFANLAFIPWQNQYVTVYDLAAGEEVARVTLRHQVSHAFSAGGVLYFGELGATALDPKIAGASRNEASHIALPSRELPGNPRWMQPGGMVRKVTSDAYDRIALYALPELREGAIDLDSQRYYATYYRIVVGLRGGTGELTWARKVDQDVIAAAAYQGGLAACLQSGRVVFFAASDGSDAGSVSLSEPLRSCVVQAGAFTSPRDKAKGVPLVDQIAQAIDVQQTEMVMMQRFLVRELVGLQGEEATRVLVDLASDSRLSPWLLRDVREGLASRRTGASYLLEALRKHYDYIGGVLQPPPVGPIADALASMKETRAAPLLAEHLLDPSHQPDDIKRVAQALEVLATASEAEAMRTFFSLYRPTADDPDLLQAVLAVARALVRLGDAEGRQLVEHAATDSMTVPSLRSDLAQVVKPSADGG